MDPQVSPDLASKVLTAELRNAIKDVSDGGKLTPAHRRLMQEISLTPELAAQQRAAALLQKYCDGGDLTAAQWEEIRSSHPGFADVPVPATAAPAEEPAASKVKLSKADEARYAALYKKGWRQIRRWIEKGEKAADPCPLHDPRALMHWWPRHNTWRVPPEIEAAAVEAAKAAATQLPQPVGLHFATSDEAEKSKPAPELPPAPAPPPEMKPSGKSINLEDFDPEEGDRLRELKQLQSAKFAQLKHALERGDDTTLLEGKYVKLCETIDKIETRVTERLKKRGLFILRDAVERDLAAAAELLRQSRTSMQRRVLELCPSLNGEQRTEVATAIDRARSQEERILARLDSLTADDLLRDLAA